MRHRLIACALMLAALAAPAQTTTKLTASKVNDFGLIYSLPSTMLDITIETEHVKKEPGEFWNYAKRNLNITDAITAPSQTARVKSVTITPRGVADNSNQWLMQFKGGQGVYVVLNAANLPVAINTEKIPEAKAPALPVAKAAEPTPLEVPAASQAITQDMAMSTSTSKRAALATERIFELRENRNDLISGQADNVPPDGKSMQLALDNLAAQEAALTAMFAGTVKTWTEVNTISIMPDSTDMTDLVIARISPIDGLVGAEDLSGSPIYLSLEVLEKGALPLDEKGQPRPFPKGGVAYCIPGAAKVAVKADGRTVASQQVDLAQLGVVYGLDPKQFADKKSQSYLLLNPTTGAILTLGVNN